MKVWTIRGLLFAAAIAVVAQQPRVLPTPAQGINNNLRGVNRRVLEMAKDFPADRYDFRAAKDVRSFGEVILHVMAGNTYAAKIARGETADWDKEEVDPKAYKGKDQIVAAFQKSVDDVTEAVQKLPPDQINKTLAPYLAVIEHAGEHYGQLVVYYRLNAMVPPASRPQPKK
jgi:uncharacterized damage-inducible protein DinB